MRWWHKIPKLAKTTVKIEEGFSYPKQVATSFKKGDLVENIRVNSSLRGLQGRITSIGKRYSNYCGGKYREVDDINVTWSTGQTGRYLVPLAAHNLKLIKKQEKEMSSGNFIVWCPFGGNPSARHQTEKEAEQEASRLAKLNPNKQFYVCQLKSVSEIASVVTRRL